MQNICNLIGDSIENVAENVRLDFKIVNLFHLDGETVLRLYCS